MAIPKIIMEPEPSAYDIGKMDVDRLQAYRDYESAVMSGPGDDRFAYAKRCKAAYNRWQDLCWVCCCAMSGVADGTPERITNLLEAYRFDAPKDGI